jgi:protein TonB
MAVAVALSAAVHALLLGLPARPAVPARDAGEVELEVVRVAPPPSAAGAGTSAAPRPAAPPAPPRPTPVPTLATPAGEEPGPEGVSVPAGGEGRGAAPAAPGGDGREGDAAAGSEGAAAGGHDPGLQAAYLGRLYAAVQQAFEYPRRARRSRLEGRVLVEVVLEGEGRPRSVRLAASSGHDLLDAAALDTVRRVHFPAPPEGLPRAIASRPVLIPVDYRLDATPR